MQTSAAITNIDYELYDWGSQNLQVATRFEASWLVSHQELISGKYRVFKAKATYHAGKSFSLFFLHNTKSPYGGALISIWISKNLWKNSYF